jgi:quercetin dioxygenase-like cupin family protein
MHTTDTIDIVTVISGEAIVLLDTGETTMRQGDTIVQRGTKHAWRNRADKPCVVSAVHISVIR